MNITTLNMTTLDGGVIIKRGEGGGSMPPSGESTIEYLDVSGLGDTNESLRYGLVMLADIVKSKNEGGTFVGVGLLGIQSLFGISTNNATTCIAVAIDFTRPIKVKLANEQQPIEVSITDAALQFGATKEQLASLPRLTKEQFYSLD